jgi:hypothetical protein
MQPYQWFLLGAMAAWTPGLIILALCLWRAPSIDDHFTAPGFHEWETERDDPAADVKAERAIAQVPGPAAAPSKGAIDIRSRSDFHPRHKAGRWMS